MNRRLVLILSFLGLVLTACSSAPPRQGLPPVVEGGTPPRAQGPRVSTVPETARPVEIPVPPPAPAGGAVVALLDRADSYRKSGNVAGEAATLERALRIEPNNAHLWSRLAAVRLEEGQPRQAEQLALKSNALAGGDKRLQARNWRLVAQARWALDDSAGARAAEQRARSLEQH